MIKIDDGFAPASRSYQDLGEANIKLPKPCIRQATSLQHRRHILSPHAPTLPLKRLRAQNLLFVAQLIRMVNRVNDLTNLSDLLPSKINLG